MGLCAPGSGILPTDASAGRLVSEGATAKLLLLEDQVIPYRNISLDIHINLPAVCIFLIYTGISTNTHNMYNICGYQTCFCRDIFCETIAAPYRPLGLAGSVGEILLPKPCNWLQQRAIGVIEGDALIVGQLIFSDCK